MAELCAAAVAEGFTLVKLKVGARLEDDLRRCAIAREVVGADVGIAVDANQVWDVPTAIPWVRALAQVPAGVDRGADEPGRHPRHGRDPPGASARSGSPPASTSPTG